MNRACPECGRHLVSERGLELAIAEALKSIRIVATDKKGHIRIVDERDEKP